MRTQIDRWEYEIDENNVISAWYLDGLNSDIEGCPPNLRQPHHPDGSAWVDADAAKTWIEGHIRAFTHAVAEAEKEAESDTETQSD